MENTAMLLNLAIVGDIKVCLELKEYTEKLQAELTSKRDDTANLINQGRSHGVSDELVHSLEEALTTLDVMMSENAILAQLVNTRIARYM